MKERLYFDTSALIKEFISELGSDLIDKVVAAAREQRIQIVSSIWSINETLSVIDRLSRQKDERTKKAKLTKAEIQGIIATIAERINSSNQQADFFFTPIDHAIVVNSRELIDTCHISPVDALHVYTGWVYDCAYFLVHDKKLSSRITPRYKDMMIIELANHTHKRYLESQLGL